VCSIRHYHAQFVLPQASIFGKVDGFEQQIKIMGRLHQNRAIQGDAVVVELLPRSEWQTAFADGVAVEDNGKFLALRVYEIEG